MNDMILILNYSDEFSMDIAGRLRAEQIYSRIVDGSVTAEQVKAIAPRGIILSGEAHRAGGTLDSGILDLDIPVLALGHTAHMMLCAQGGACADVVFSDRKAHVEYGDSILFSGIAEGERYFEDAVMLMLPPDVRMTASAGGCTIAFEHVSKKQYGVQFELERNDPEGSALLKNFARMICGCSGWWSMDAALHEAENTLERAAERGGHALCAVSGGVDSAVAALLAHRAFGEKMIAVFVDTGMMREGEADDVERMYAEMDIPLLRMDRSGEVLEALAGKQGKADKRAVVTRILHNEMISQSTSIEGEKLLVLGTNYSDFLHTGSSEQEWVQSGMTVVEPLMELFKDEVRAIAARLGFDESLVSRKPFPALGLGARIVGEITGARLDALRMAESIFHEEIKEAGLDRKLYKYFPILISGEDMMGSEVMILRAVTLSGGQLIPARLPYDLVERTVERIMQQSESIVRVFYDQTPTPLGQESFN